MRLRRKVIKEFSRGGDEGKIRVTQINEETFCLSLVSPTSEDGIEDFFSTLSECYLALLEDPKWQEARKRLTLEHLDNLQQQIQEMADKYSKKADEVDLGSELWGIFQSMYNDLIHLQIVVEHIMGKGKWY